MTQKWNGIFFETITLQSMGLRVQLGHGVCTICPHPQPRQVEFIVVAENGIHAVHLDWCGCPGSKDRLEQLMDMGWWPATQTDPETAFTMSGLRFFHVLNLQAKIPPTDYYRALEQLSNGHGLTPCPVSHDISSAIDTLTPDDSNVFPPSCWQFDNGDTLKCVNVLGAATAYRE